MEQLKTISMVRHWRHAIASSETIVFVPTMGNLHQGHLSLIKLAKHSGDRVIVSIFVNPMQFAAHEDLDQYPRTLDEDLILLEKAGVDAVFLPTIAMMYPEGFNEQEHTQITVKSLDYQLCSVTRPHFFTGVATVVNKLLMLIQPQILILGEKDYQQVAVIRKMINDLFIEVRVKVAPTVRDENGLALSSRNHYLTDYERNFIAPKIYETLCWAKEMLIKKNDFMIDIERLSIEKLSNLGMEVIYFKIVNSISLCHPEPSDHDLVICVAVMVANKVRLIDNISLKLID